MKKSKNNSFETLRILAAVFIVLLHYQDFSLGSFNFVREVFRFPVPFFFALSGFLLAEKTQREGKRGILKYVKKIVVLSLFWNLFYFFAYFLTGVVSVDSFEQIFLLFFNGKGAYHLWFFTSLWMTALLFYIFGSERINLLLVCSMGLYLFGVLASSYSATKFGILSSFSTRDFIFFSSLPFFLGAYISIKKIKTTLSVAILIFLVGFLFHSLEVHFLRSHFALKFSDYVFSTFLMGVGGLLIGLKQPKMLEVEKFSNLGKYSLGLYALHVFVYHGILLVLERFQLVGMYCLLPVLTVSISIFLVMSLRKIYFFHPFL